VRLTISRLWPYAIPPLSFVGYWVWNGSVAYSGSVAGAHPDVSLHAGMPFFALFLVAALLPVQTIEGGYRFGRSLGERPVRLLGPLLVFLGFAMFFSVDHPYNRLALGINIRNAGLMLVQHHAWAWWIFGLIATLAATSLRSHGFVRPEGWLLIPVAALFLAGSWLIEPRYALIPLTLYLTLRRPGTTRAELATVALWSIAAVYLLIGIFDSRLII
jgi:hypothetical protein